MSLLLRCISAFAVLLLLSNVVFAEIPPLPPETLASQAEIIATGIVQSITTKEESPKKDFVDTNYMIRLAIGSIEKGTVYGNAKIISVQGWEVKKRPDAWVGPGGHYSYPGFHRLSDIKEKYELR